MKIYLRPKSIQYKFKVLGLDPVAFWALDETSGSTAEDISVNNNHAAYVNGTLASSAIAGKKVWAGDGSTSLVNLYSAGLNTVYPKSTGTLLIWGAFTGTWTDGVDSYLFNIYIMQIINFLHKK